MSWMSESDPNPVHIESEEHPTCDCCMWTFNFTDDHIYTVELCILNINDYLYYFIRITNTVYDVSCGNWGGAPSGARDLESIIDSCRLQVLGKTYRFHFVKTPVAGVDYPDPPTWIPEDVIYVGCAIQLDMSQGFPTCDPFECQAPVDAEPNRLTVQRIDTSLERIDETSWGGETEVRITWQGGYLDTTATLLAWYDTNNVGVCEGCWPCATFYMSVSLAVDPRQRISPCLLARFRSMHPIYCGDRFTGYISMIADNEDAGCLQGTAYIRTTNS